MSEISNPALLSIDLEVTNMCINNCSICPRKNIRRSKGFMSFETLITVADTLKEYRPLITISGMGDPLLHPDIPVFIKYLKTKKFRVGLVVNIASLLYLDQKILKRIIESGTNQITISVPSIEEKTLKNIYSAKIDLKQIQEKFREISILYGKDVRFRASAIITDLKENEESYRDFFYNNFGIPVWITKIHSRGGNLKRCWLYNGREIKENEGCNLFVFHSFIDKNGNILSCCHDLTGETAFAHISEGAEEILIKKKVILKRVPLFQLCNHCDEPLRFIKLPKNLEKLNFYQFTKKVKIY